MKKRDWAEKDYASEANEFVGCYGVGYCWDEFVYEYCGTWEHDTLRCPDSDKLLAAIYDAERKEEKSA